MAVGRKARGKKRRKKMMWRGKAARGCRREAGWDGGLPKMERKTKKGREYGWVEMPENGLKKKETERVRVGRGESPKKGCEKTK